MSTLALTLRQVRYQNKAYWRNPAAAFFTFAFPIMFLIIFNGIFGEAQFFVPSISAFSIITACYTNIAMSVTFAREEGVLKRVRGTPLPPVSYLTGRVIHALLIAYLLVFIMAAFGTVFYGVDLPRETLLPFLVSIGIGGAAFCAMGLAITALIPNEDAAPPIVNALILPLSFVSDIFVPTADVPEWLRRLADLFPLKHIANAMSTAFNPPASRNGWETVDLVIVAAWGLGALLIAARTFRWEPRR